MLQIGDGTTLLCTYGLCLLRGERRWSFSEASFPWDSRVVLCLWLPLQLKRWRIFWGHQDVCCMMRMQIIHIILQCNAIPLQHQHHAICMTECRRWCNTWKTAASFSFWSGLQCKQGMWSCPNVLQHVLPAFPGCSPNSPRPAGRCNLSSIYWICCWAPLQGPVQPCLEHTELWQTCQNTDTALLHSE